MIKIGIMLVLVGTLIISLLTTQVYAKNIIAYIHINEEAIDSGDLKHMAWYTVDGKNDSAWHMVAGKPSSGFHHDMQEWVYPDSPGTGPNYEAIEDELMVADNASEICYVDLSWLYGCVRNTRYDCENLFADM